jgi:glycerol kinase
MQEQARLANMGIDRPHELETTARGAAMLAAVGAGLFEDQSAARQMSPIERSFEPPSDGKDRRVADREGWKEAVARTRSQFS